MRECVPTVLVVDDEEDLRIMLKDILSVRYRVELAVDGVDALDKLAAKPQIELVLTDLRMPNMDGMELLEHLCRDRAEVGTIIISAHGAVADAVDAMRAGAFDYITKPLPADFNEVYARIDRYFEMSRLHRERESLQEQIRQLAHFPRSNPNYVARALMADGDIRICPGNDKTAGLLERVGGAPAADGSYSYRDTASLFPDGFADELQRIRGGDEVVEVERVAYDDRYFRHTYTPFVDDREQIFLNLVDITRQIENEELRTMLEAGMEHEFKNHLMSITPNAEMLHGELLGPLDDLQKQTVGHIMDAGNALLESLTQRLEFSRAYSGSLQLRCDSIDLYDMARHTFVHLQAAHPQARFLLEKEAFDNASTRPRGICADADASYIERVFNNLVGNAVKYSPWVDVRIERQEECIKVEIEDGGEGMDADDCSGIWSLGYRAKNRKGGSTGIGLPYSKLIIEAHGGRIGVRSTPGRGSTFFFTLASSAGGKST